MSYHFKVKEVKRKSNWSKINLLKLLLNILYFHTKIPFFIQSFFAFFSIFLFIVLGSLAFVNSNDKNIQPGYMTLLLLLMFNILFTSVGIASILFYLQNKRAK